MAAGVVIEPKSALIKARIDEVKGAYAKVKRIMDALVPIKNSGGGNNWTAVGVALGEADATAGQAVYENLDAMLAYMTSANDAASPMDGGSL